MDLPKNITQVGETDRNCKIYVEDYVVSYMRQMNKFAEEKEIAIALFGKMTLEQQITYCFVYGACVVQSISREVRHLSQAQNQEVERARKKYFPEQSFLGYQILNGDMIEGFRIYDQNSCRYVKGYACFFEKNDTMLAYMLEARLEEAQPENVEQDKYEEVRRRQEERRVQFEGKQSARRINRETESREKRESIREEAGNTEGNQRRFRAIPFILTAAACLAVLTYFRNGELKTEIAGRLTAWVEDIAKPKLDSIVTGDDLKMPVIIDETMENQEVQAVMGTLVTEDKLADAVLEENESAAESEAPPEMTPLPENTGETKVPETEFIVESEAEQPQAESEVKPEVEEESQLTVQRMESYVIQPGDTLIAISTRVYGNENAVTQICALNNIKNPDNIQIGQKILLP